MRTCEHCGCYIPDNWNECPACKHSTPSPLARKILNGERISSIGGNGGSATTYYSGSAYDTSPWTSGGGGGSGVGYGGGGSGIINPLLIGGGGSNRGHISATGEIVYIWRMNDV